MRIAILFVMILIDCFFSNMSPSLELRSDNVNRFRTGLSLFLCLTARIFKD